MIIETRASAVDDAQLYATLFLSKRRLLSAEIDRSRKLFSFSQPHRISVRSVTVNRKTSKDAACTMIIGKDAPLGPSCVRASNVTATSSVISWLPSNSNFQHTVTFGLKYYIHVLRSSAATTWVCLEMGLG